MPAWIGAGVGVAQAVTGLINNGKAKREAKALEASRPMLKDSPYLNDQLNLAKSELTNGMSGQARQAYENENDRALSGSLNTILKGGGDVNNVADVFDKSSEGRARLAMMNDNLRLSQISNLVNSQNANEQFRQEQFGINDYAPWKDKVAANGVARAGANSQIWGGLSQAASGAISALAPKYPTDGSTGSGSYSKNGFAQPLDSLKTTALTTTPSVTANYSSLPSTISAPALNTSSINVTPSANAATGWQGYPYPAPQQTAPDYATYMSNYLNQ